MKKKGFSLAEVLIALGIVSVIATMGFTIAKRGIERAYDLYIYSGYKGITDAIADANTVGYDIEKGNVNNCNFTQHVYRILQGKETGVSNINDFEFTAPNTITYRITSLGTKNNKNYYTIKMQIPSRKKKIGNNVVTKNTICLAYLPDDDYGVLIPFDSYANCTSTVTGLYDRMDLLPFYIDDGEVGRVINGVYKPKKYYSAKDALCKAHGGTISGFFTLLTCGASASIPGSVRVESPRKAF